MAPKSRNPSLWSESAAWRWLFAAAVLCSALVFIGHPWRSQAIRDAALLSAFDPSKVLKPSNPVAAASEPRQRQQLPERNAPPDQIARSSPPPPPVPVQSQVVWNNTRGGTISGAGLIAAYCCTESFSAVIASKPVTSGRHYWELTLTVKPGELFPDTWTDAGVTTDSRTLANSPPRPQEPGLQRAGQASLSILGLGQQRHYRTGDVFMFALDADRGLLYYGVNGQWKNGRPGEAGGEAAGVAGSSFTPFATISAVPAKSAPEESDRWAANFGGSSYKYPVPPTFSAYAASAALPRAAPAMPLRTSGQQPSPLTPDRAQSPLYGIFEGEFTVSGQRIPLPNGKWLGLAYFRGQADTTNGDTVVLGRVEKNRVTGIIAINAYSSTGQNNGFPAFKACDRSDYVHINRQANEAFGPQRCWWINHASQIWDQPIFRAARTVLEERGVAIPSVLVNVGFRRANAKQFCTAFYLYNPEAASISSQSTTWNMSEWHKDRISLDARRVDYVKNLRDWGNDWAPAFYAMGSK